MPGDAAGNQKADWITAMLAHDLPVLFPKVRAFVWFDENKAPVEHDGEDWSLATPAERAAFAAAVARPPYTPNAPIPVGQ